jgi:hypothetical protein
MPSFACLRYSTAPVRECRLARHAIAERSRGVESSELRNFGAAQVPGGGSLGGVHLLRDGFVMTSYRGSRLLVGWRPMASSRRSLLAEMAWRFVEQREVLATASLGQRLSGIS